MNLTQEQRQLLLAVLEAAITGDKTHTYTERGRAQLIAIKEQV